jgi:hypothetical protein
MRPRVCKQCLALYHRLLVSLPTFQTTQIDEKMKCCCHRSSLALIVVLWCSQIMVLKERLYRKNAFGSSSCEAVGPTRAQSSSKNFMRKLLNVALFVHNCSTKPSPSKNITMSRHEAGIRHMPARIADPSSPTNKVRTPRTSM